MKNRTVIGIICMILAVAIAFGIAPMVSRMAEGKVDVLTFTQNLGKGAQITEDDITVTSLLRAGLPEGAISAKSKTDVIGKYTNSDVYKGDVVTPSKLADDANASDNILSALSGDKVAMSITIKSFAGGLSGKIQNGDIVSIYVTEKDKASTVPPELKYVRVITTTTSGGVDENEVVPNEDGTFDLPTTMTVLVTVKQAEILADYEKNATMHVALVYRGNDETAEKFIKTQDKFLKDQEKNREKTQEGKTDA